MIRKDISNILIISLSNIGDVVLTLPVAGVLLDKFPKANISILVGMRAAEVVKDNPEFFEVIIYDKHKSLKEKLSFLKLLRKKKYDLVVDLRHSFYPVFLGAKYHTPFFFRKKFPEEHRFKKHLYALERLGLNVDRVRFPFFIPEESREKITAVIEGKGNRKIVVINPAAASHLKCWGEDKFISLAKKLKEISDFFIVIIGGEKDKGKSSKISCAIDGSLDLSGKLNLKDLAALLERTNIFITNDSGPLHLASAFRIPTLAIFGPSDPVKYGPLSPINRVARRQLACSPCELAQCPKEHQCMELLSVDEVFLAFKEILNEKNKNSE